ncbi:MAG: gliding motility-associated C-terminal domain-containing protein [Crocinitomicaceae bacterium]
MKKIAFLTFALILASFGAKAQDTIWFNYTGGPQQYVVDGCINGDIQIVIAGAQGGTQGFAQGGNGAVLSGTINVSGGDVIDIMVGQQPTGPGAGFNGGGAGQASTNGNTNYDAMGGGGSTNVNVNGGSVAIAAGGGGAGGGSVPGSTWASNGGGDGGCATGSMGGNTYGDGGLGGTQTAGGAGGQPWAGVPPGGSPGSLGQGGLGGLWVTASGGGGGGGYYGGGGGGNDGCCTGANGGGGGGGGSSLIPAGVGCVAGDNTGNGYAYIVIPECATTICSGDTAFVDFAPQFPVGATNFTVTPPLGVYQATPGDAMVGFHPVDTTDYTVTATVGGGPVSISWPVNAVDPIFPDAGLDDSLCFDIANAATLNGTLANDGDFYWQFEGATTFSGGFGNALFTPDNLTLSTTINGNQAGVYEFILFESDTTGVCEDGSDTMLVYYSVESHTTTLTDPDCYQGTNGQIVVDSDASPASGNLGAANYSIDGGTTWQTSNTFTGLTAGIYDVVSEDYLGCQFASQVELVDPPEITVTLASSDTTLCQNGTATLNAYGSNAPVGGTYTYTWDAGTSTTGQNIITPTPAGTDMTVSVFVTTDLGCVSQPVSLDITHHDPISLTITANDSVCPGYDSQHTVTATGGFNGYDYAWTANGTPMADISNEININPTMDTEYCVTVTDVCETTPEVICTNTIMRNVPDPLFTSDVTWGCNPSDITFMNMTDPIDSDSITWLINGTYYYNQDPLTVAFEEVGTYDVWLEVYSEYGCFNSINAVDYITIHDVPDPLFYINPNPTTIFNTALDMNNITPGANNTYLWSFPGGSPASSSLESPSVLYPEGIPADYPIELLVTNEWGCSDSVSGVAHIVSDVIIYAPNIFTPDGDEFNETWRVHIDGIDIYDFHLTMFNRWGEPVWESYNQVAEWKGNYGPNGVQDGTFVWVIECKEIATDKKYEFRGHVTVLK